MPIAFRSLLSSSVANATFLDKTIDDTKVGKLSLYKVADTEDEYVDDAQLSIYYNSKQVYATESIIVAGSVSKDDNVREQIRRVQGDAASVTLATTPFGSSTSTADGVLITLRGMSDTNTVTIENNDIQYGAVLNGSLILKKYNQITLMYDATEERWIEQGRVVFS